MLPVFLGGYLGPQPDGTAWVQTDISVPAIVRHGADEWALAWVMAEKVNDPGGDHYLQVGWYSTPDGVFPFFEWDNGGAANYHRTIFWDDPLTIGRSYTFALSNDEGTSTWHYWMNVDGALTELGSSVASFGGNEGAEFERFVELQSGGDAMPSVGPVTFNNAGVVTLGTWNPEYDMTAQ